MDRTAPATEITTSFERYLRRPNRRRLARVVGCCHEHVWSVALNVTGDSNSAADVCQDVFLGLLLRPPPPGSVRSPRGYLSSRVLTIARRQRRAALRRLARERRAAECAFEAKNRQPAELDELLEAIEELPERPRKVLELRYLAGLSNSEIAEALDISVRSVERDLNQGRELLRDRLGKLSSLAIIGVGRDRGISAPPELFDDLLRVVRMGGALGSLTAPAVISGALFMKKTFVASGLAIFLISFLGWWKFTGDDEPTQIAPSFVEADLTTTATEPPPPEHANVVSESAETQPPAGDADARQETRTFEVTCVDADGNPVAGSEVYLVEMVSGDHGKTIGPINCDDDGLASFEGIPSDAEPWLLRFYARLPGGDLAGFGKHSVSREALAEDADDTDDAGETSSVVVLRETAVFEGVVIVPDRTDPPAVTISAETLYFRDPESASPVGESFETRGVSGEQLWPELFRTTPDAEGRFIFGELPAYARIGLVARGPGLARATHLVRPPWSGEEIVIDMVREGVIEGDLTYADDGLPAVGVVIVASALHTGRPFESVIDSDGRFRFDGLPANVYDLSLPTDFDRSEWTMAATNSIKVLVGQTTGNIHVRLERGALVTGTVSDASTGLPVSMSVMAISGWGKGGRPIGGSFTDDEGRYEIRLPRGQSTLYLANILPEYRYPDDQVQRRVEIGDSVTLKEDVNFQLPRRDAPQKAITIGRAQGRVIGVDGHPLEGVSVRAYTLHDPDNPILGIYNRTTRTDEKGSYELFVPADHELHLMAGGSRFSSAEARRFWVEEDGVHEVEILVLRSGTSFIEGRVVDSDGEPAQRASIWVSSRNKRSLGQDPVLTDPDGYFRVEYLLEDEPLEVAVTKPGYARRRYAKVPPGSTDLRFEIRREE